MPKWLCDTCSYMVETEGKTPPPAEGLKPTPWDLPDSWACPICGSPRDTFSPLDPAELLTRAACNRYK